MDGFLELGLGFLTVVTTFVAMAVFTLRAKERRLWWKPSAMLLILALACLGGISLIGVLQLPNDMMYWPALPVLGFFLFTAAAVGTVAGALVAFPIRLWLDRL